MRGDDLVRSMNRRGQSEVIGVVLIFGLVVAGTSGIVVFGSTAISDTQGLATSGAAEHAMTQLDSKASLVAYGDSDSQRARLPGRQSARRSVEPDRGWMNVTIRNENGTVEDVLMNVTLGAVVYEDDGDTIAYQGGGVWRKRDGGGSHMVSPPEFHYRGTTITLPLVVVDGDGTLNERVRVSERDAGYGVYPNETNGRANPLTEGTVVVEVHSEYYDAWGRFFADRTGGDTSVDHDNETVRIELVTPAQTDPIPAGLTSTAAGDEIELSGGGNDPAFVDSYDSSVGIYNVSEQDDGTIITTGSLTMQGNSKVEGDVRTGGSISLDAVDLFLAAVTR